jgi:hypothetical protein
MCCDALQDVAMLRQRLLDRSVVNVEVSSDLSNLNLGQRAAPLILELHGASQDLLNGFLVNRTWRICHGRPS